MSHNNLHSRNGVNSKLSLPTSKSERKLNSCDTDSDTGVRHVRYIPIIRHALDIVFVKILRSKAWIGLQALDRHYSISGVYYSDSGVYLFCISGQVQCTRLKRNFDFHPIATIAKSRLYSVTVV